MYGWSAIEPGKGSDLRSPVSESSIGRNRSLTYESHDMKRRARITEYFIEQLKSSEGIFTKFTEEMFRGPCDRMTVCKEDFVRVRFRNGVEIDVEY